MPVERLRESDPRRLGPYRILARLGRGAMGAVYLGETEAGTAAAVKVVKPELARDPELRARFTREVEAARRVSGRCVARFLDADLAAKAPWLATEYVAGPTLDAQVEREGPETGPRLLGLAVGLADALVSIHGAGLVHRDLKPGNIVLAADAPKVIDFGVVSAGDSATLTTTGSLVGSPAYMAPEQAEGRPDVGPAADVFSWASCVVYAARGEPPFGRGEAAGMLYKVVNQPADLTGVAPYLVPLLHAALDKDPSARPTAAGLLDACVALGEERAAPHPAVAASDPGAADQTIVKARASQPPPATAEPERRSRRGLLVAVLAAVLLSGALAVALLRSDEPQHLVVDNASNGSTVKAVYTGDPVWMPAKHAPGYYGNGYRISKLQTPTAPPEDAFSFWFLVRDGEPLQRTVEAWWTSMVPGEPTERNSAVPFIVRNARGNQLGRVVKDQKVGHATWNHIGRYTFSPGWNSVLISRIANPALGKDIIADAVRITP